MPPSNRWKLNKSAPKNHGGVGSVAEEAGLYWVFREVGPLAGMAAGGPRARRGDRQRSMCAHDDIA